MGIGPDIADYSSCMSNAEEIPDFSGFPQTPDFLGTIVPAQTSYIIDGQRLIVTAIERWSTHATIHFVWPVQPKHLGRPGLRTRAVIPTVIDNNGVHYGWAGGSSGGGGASEMFTEATRTTRPVPEDVATLNVVGYNFSVMIRVQ